MFESEKSSLGINKRVVYYFYFDVVLLEQTKYTLKSLFML